MPALLVINPVSGVSPSGLAQREAYVRSCLGSGWDVRFETLHQGPASIESREEKAIAAAQILEFIRDGFTGDRAASSQVDAMVVWCAGDPGVQAARELTTIPVVGPGESAIHLASLLGGRFTWLTPLMQGVHRTREFIQSLGFEGQLASVRAIGLPVLELRKNLDETVRRLTALGREAVERDGAGSLVLGCMGLYGVAQRLEQAVGVPVVDPAEAGSLVARMLVDGEFRFSRTVYPAPPKA